MGKSQQTISNQEEISMEVLSNRQDNNILPDLHGVNLKLDKSVLSFITPYGLVC